ncbi:MAG: hypothetical protein SPL80_07200 [Bacilli bacterium]|nr:hypothetical protein [Bacilli bacterium]
MATYIKKSSFLSDLKSFDGKTVQKSDILLMKKKFEPLLGAQFNVLSLPEELLMAFEPSQVGSIVGNLIDACIPFLSKITDSELISAIGLSKNEGILGEREGYPDYLHSSGLRVELKLIFVDNPDIKMRKPPTKREPSARLTQKVTFKNVIPEKDLLLVIAYALKEDKKKSNYYVPTIIGFDLFPVIDCIIARDKRMYEAGSGVWFGNYETPTVLSKKGQNKLIQGQRLIYSYGTKENEGCDFNLDTNFGKLKRIPYPALQKFISISNLKRLLKKSNKTHQ